MSGIIDKIFGNKVVDDSPSPEIPVHTDYGQNFRCWAPQSIYFMQIKTGAVGDSQLMDLSVTEQKLADLAVATQKIKRRRDHLGKSLQGGIGYYFICPDCRSDHRYGAHPGFGGQMGENRQP